MHDKEFGDILIRRHGWVRGMRASVRPDGRLGITIGNYTPLLAVRQMVRSNRTQLRTLLESQERTIYQHGDTVGKSHHIFVARGEKLQVRRKQQVITVTLPTGLTMQDRAAQDALRPIVIAALKKEAKAYLPRRLAHLAAEHGLHYSTVRFSHASSRWGSCSSRGTISLNIALMNLSHELIDYVLLHELAHTKHMNHSSEFWQLLESMDTRTKEHRAALRALTPHV